MLQKDNISKILNLFFENPSPRGVGFQLREISRKVKVAPPSVKKYLKDLEKEDLIKQEKHRIFNYPVYLANRDNEKFKFLKKLSNIEKIKESGILEYLNENCMPNVIVLFGSYSSGEDIQESDIDLFLVSKEKKLNLNIFEKRLNRRINLLCSEKFSKLSEELKNNIINGVILQGYLKVF